MKRRDFIMTCLLLMFQMTLMAQVDIDGFIKNKGTTEPLENANVVLMPGGQGTVSDFKGYFKLKNVESGEYQLKVSVVGYETLIQTITVKEGAEKRLQIELIQDNKRLVEVDIFENLYKNQLVQLPLSEPLSLKATTSHVSKDDIQKQGAVTVIDALKYVPGGWTETRGRKVKQFFSVRGQKYPYPSYSINGIWQKEFHETPYFLSSANIEEIKIIRSSAALVKSLSPLVGVIDITARKPEVETFDVSMKYGSLNSYHSELGYSNVHNNVSYTARVGSFGTDGPDGRNGAERLWNASGNFNWTINSHWDWSFNLMYLTGKRELVQPIAPADEKFSKRQEEYDPIKTLWLSSKLRYKKSDRLTSELDISYTGRQAHYINNNLASGALSEMNEDDFELTLNQINAIKLGTSNTFRVGALYNYWEAPEGKRFYVGNAARVHTVSGVITDEHVFGKFIIDGGFRLTGEYFDEWGGFSIEGSGGKFSKVNAIKDEWQSPVWNATIGFSYLVNSKSSWHYSMASGIVTPRKGALNNEGVKPENETRVNIDLGYVRTIGQQGQVSITGFLVNRTDAISYNGQTIEKENGDIMELYYNSDKRNYGVEAEFKSPLLWNAVSMFTNVTWMKGEEKQDNDWVKDDEMPNWIVNAGVNYQKRRWDANAYLHHVGDYKNNRFVSKSYLKTNGKASLGDFVTLDLNVGYEVLPKYQMRLFGEVKNVFDKKYQTVVGYPDYGTIFSMGINMKF
ncbi:MAG: TonB-dependent receptor [Carboxylicivirga sp.]|jgi:outer membrane cobalamin receptor|nr:TonB-dependent receptor [Carboxylicivirga sp.]